MSSNRLPGKALKKINGKEAISVLINRIKKSSVKKLVITDTIPKIHRSSKVREISVAPFLAKTIKAVVANESISSTWRSNNK